MHAIARPLEQTGVSKWIQCKVDLGRERVQSVTGKGMWVGPSRMSQVFVVPGQPVKDLAARRISMIHSRSKLVLPGVLVLAGLVGCNARQEGEEPAEYPTAESTPPPPPALQAPSPAQGSPGTTGATAAPPGTATAPGTGTATAPDPDLLLLTVIAVDIDTKLAQVCRLPGSSVFFKYNSAKLLPEAKERLQQIATCVTTGPARGKDLVIVGRADPVGSDEYNKKLGMSRADSVAKYLRDLGVPKARVETESRGEATAMREPFGWPLERRVTVRLQEP